MNIIIPMAGMGKRMRPHTLTTPKPLIPVAGKPIVQWLAEDLAKVCREKIEEIGFVIGDFGKEVEDNLLKIAENLGAKGRIYYQKEALGTAHAILCAQELLKDKVIVAFADTLFKADFKLNDEEEGIIWVHKVEDPRAFGVIKLDKEGIITDFIEKPEQFISDLAIIGIYYFKDGSYLKKEMQYLIDNNIREKGEYQLTNALENMKKKGVKFKPGAVAEWLDCGNKNATVYTNQRVLEINKGNIPRPGNITSNNSVIISPCFIGKNVKIENSIVGPHVSLGDNAQVENSIIRNSIVQANTKIKKANLENAMLGNHVEYSGATQDVSIGDFTTIN